MSQYHFHFYDGGPSGLPKQGLVVTTTPPAADARMVRSVSHPPPRAPLPLRNVLPRPASTPPGRLSRDRSPDRHRNPRRERSQRHHHRSRSRRRQRRHHHHSRRPQPAENTAEAATARAPPRSASLQAGPPVPRPASAAPGLLQPVQPGPPRPRPTVNPAIRMVSLLPGHLLLVRSVHLDSGHQVRVQDLCPPGPLCNFKRSRHLEMQTLIRFYSKLQPPFGDSLPVVSLHLL